MWLALLVAPDAMAEERFYPIVGPDGRMELIRSEPAAAPRAGAAADVPATPPAAAAAARGDAGPVQADAPAVTAPEAPATTAASAELPHAAYDSDEYVDSEAVEAAAAAPAAGKKRFYMIDDGLGVRTSESGGDQGGELVAPVAAPAAPERDMSQALTVSLHRWSPAEAATDMPWLPACAAAELLERATPLVGGVPVEQVVTAADYAFLAPNRVLGGYRLQGEGPRTLVLRSYARKRQQPAFLHPRLAFLDGKGCLTRVIYGYFERIYPASDRRHAYLRADLVVHTGEEWLLLLAPKDTEMAAAAVPWRESGIGQLKFTLKK